MPKIDITITNGIGVERTLSLPAKYEVCESCRGEGKHVNPAIDGNGLSQEDFDQDPDFEEAYFSGVYDIQCLECKGARVVAKLDYEAMNDRGRRWYLGYRMGKSRGRIVKRIHEMWEDQAEYDRMCEMERRYGA